MQLTVLGATGATGRLVVQRAVDAGHTITAVVRRPDALPAQPQVCCVVTDLRDGSAMRKALTGTDAVISALGATTGGPTTVCTDGVCAVLAAMAATAPTGTPDARRLVVVSAHGAAESRDRSPYSLVLRASVGAKMRDKDAMEALLRASDARWTLVRPPFLGGDTATGRYHVGTDLAIGLRSKVSRADLADFLVREAVTPEWTHRAPRIAA